MVTSKLPRWQPETDTSHPEKRVVFSRKVNIRNSCLLDQTELVGNSGDIYVNYRISRGLVLLFVDRIAWE